MDMQTITTAADESARQAVAQGAEGRALRADEDAEAGDYAALDEALGRPATRAERREFRAAYSEALVEEAAYRRYRAALSRPGDAPAHEDACLSIGREFLPPCARVVLDGGPSTAAYWVWLEGQITSR